MNKIITILQARYSSTRLPGKVLLPILGQPMLIQQINRIKNSTLHGQIVIATSTHHEDEKIVNCCKENGITYYCGKLDDVLDRFYQAASLYQPDHIVRLTGDCPLIDPQIIDQVIQTHLDGNFDYTTNALKPTYPDGLDVEIFKLSALKTAWIEATLNSDREHVTPYIYRNNDQFNIGHIYNNIDLSHLRWTVDWQIDFDLIKKIFENLFPYNPRFTFSDILQFIERHPELKTINTYHTRNEGLQKSLQEDQLISRAQRNVQML